MTRYEQLVHALAAGDLDSAKVFWRSKQWDDRDRAPRRTVAEDRHHSAAGGASVSNATPLPIALPHRIKVRKVDGSRPWHADCTCEHWTWRSKYHRVALAQGIGHLINQARKAR